MADDTVLPDYIAGIIGIMLADSDINTLVGNKIYGLVFPRDEINNMPQNMITVASIGGTPIFNHMQLNFNVIEVRCYGSTYYEAWRVHIATHSLLKNISRQTHDKLLVHSVLPVNGPISLRDPEFEWPNVLSTWRLFVAEAPVT